MRGASWRALVLSRRACPGPCTTSWSGTRATFLSIALSSRRRRRRLGRRRRPARAQSRVVLHRRVAQSVVLRRRRGAVGGTNPRGTGTAARARRGPLPLAPLGRDAPQVVQDPLPHLPPLLRLVDAERPQRVDEGLGRRHLVLPRRGAVDGRRHAQVRGPRGLHRTRRLEDGCAAAAGLDRTGRKRRDGATGPPAYGRRWSDRAAFWPPPRGGLGRQLGKSKKVGHQRVPLGEQVEFRRAPRLGDGREATEAVERPRRAGDRAVRLRGQRVRRVLREGGQVALAATNHAPQRTPRQARKPPRLVAAHRVHDIR